VRKNIVIKENKKKKEISLVCLVTNRNGWLPKRWVVKKTYFDYG
jgi:hypothetical protein